MAITLKTPFGWHNTETMFARHLKNSGAILVMGPGEARTEFQKQIKSKELLAKIVGNEKCDKMTDPQLVARVREFFAAHAKSA